MNYLGVAWISETVVSNSVVTAADSGKKQIYRVYSQIGAFENKTYANALAAKVGGIIIESDIRKY